MALNHSPKIAVYTCITGGYDELTAPSYIDERIDYFCFADREYDLKPWIMQPVSKFKLNSKDTNRYIKMHAYEILQDYDITVYIDGNISIIGDLYELIMTCYSRKYDIFMYQHFARDCVYKEADSCVYNSLDWVWTIKRQMNKYFRQGYPVNYGLFEANIIIRKNTRSVQLLMDDWWSEYYSGAKRDQLSLTVCARRQGVSIYSLGDSDARIINKYFKYNQRKNNFNFKITLRKYINRFVSLFFDNGFLDVENNSTSVDSYDNAKSLKQYFSNEVASQILSISIPTYNRASILKENILAIIEEVKEYSIPIYISDNSPNNDTAKEIINLKDKYEFIFYSNRNSDIGHDKNLLYAVQEPETEYVWLLGDSFSLEAGAIKTILQVIQRMKPEIMAVNAKNRDLNIKSRFYGECNSVLYDLGWHLTLTGVTIYSRSAISTISNIGKNYVKNFPQITWVFTHLSYGNSFYWVNEKCILSSPKKKGYWASKMFTVFVDDWCKAVRQLPFCYNDEVKEKVIVEHSIKSNIFGFKALLNARYLDAYNSTVFLKYRDLLLKHSRLNINILWLISLFPKSIIRIYLFVRENRS